MKLRPIRCARRIAAGLSAILCLGVTIGPARAQTPDEQAQIVWTLERGRLLFGIDRAAWIGTDDAFAQFPDPTGAGLKGYIVEPQESGFDVIFYAGSEDDPVQAYRGRVASGGVVSREVFPIGARPPLTPMQRRLVGAVNAARQTGQAPCGSAPFNPLVIPPVRPDGPIDVYLMTPQVDDQLPLGGHFRVTVSDGSISSTRAFTNTCLLLPAPPSDTAGLGVTHLLDKVPTEIHVFTAMAAGVPVWVATNDPDRVWEVTGQEIRLVEDR